VKRSDARGSRDYSNTAGSTFKCGTIGVFTCPYTIGRPAEIDIDDTGPLGGARSFLKGLYELKDGKLRIVWRGDDKREHATHFDALKDPRLTLFVLKKPN